MSVAAPLPDILRRIVAQRRERLREHRARHPGAARAACAATAAGLASEAVEILAAFHAAERIGGSGETNGASGRRDDASPPHHPTDPNDPNGGNDRNDPNDPNGGNDRPVWSHGAGLLTGSQNPFLAALALPASPAIIAEVKMGSPRLGSLAGRVDPPAQARIYAAYGAAALSVVVEPDFFFGSYELLAECRAASGLPAIAKDFVVDPLQIVWARQAGADAVLLIAALYEPEELACYARLARLLGLVPLIETHDAADLALLAGERWELVGINNRDLRTFEVDLERSMALLPSLPREALKVAESGIRDALDVALLADSGFDAMLIGELLLLAADPGAALRALLGASAPPGSAPSLVAEGG